MLVAAMRANWAPVKRPWLQALSWSAVGAAATTSGFSVTSMADQVADTIRALRTEHPVADWFLAGHSMGGKLSAVLARRAQDGEAGLEGLRGVLLVSPSPPSPEPMSDAKRSEMLGSLGEEGDDAARNRRAAAKFVDDNTGKLALPSAVRERAIDGVLGMSRTAFRHWLESGSNEDCSGFVGQLELPALIFGGTEDGALGPDAQREATLPHFPQGKLVTLPACGHLAPLERPGELVERFTAFLAGTRVPLRTPEGDSGPRFQSLVDSHFVSPQTRAVMKDRRKDAEDWNHEPSFFSEAELLTVRALAGRIVPGAGFDLGACVDRRLKESRGDGWRYAVLPPDPEAWRKGLLSLDSAASRAHGVPFLSLYPDQQDDLLREAAQGKLGRGVLGSFRLGESANAYTAPEMERWFTDARVEFTSRYIGDPRTMERIGYTGFADDLGFTQITIGATEEFER